MGKFKIKKYKAAADPHHEDLLQPYIFGKVISLKAHERGEDKKML